MRGIGSFTDARHVVVAISKSQAIIEFDLEGRVLTANANFCSALGYSLAEIVGKHHSMFCDEVTTSSAGYKEFWGKLRRAALMPEHINDRQKAVAMSGSRPRTTLSQGMASHTRS